jgi:hypothetical protein
VQDVRKNWYAIVLVTCCAVVVLRVRNRGSNGQIVAQCLRLCLRHCLLLSRNLPCCLHTRHYTDYRCCLRTASHKHSDLTRDGARRFLRRCDPAGGDRPERHREGGRPRYAPVKCPMFCILFSVLMVHADIASFVLIAFSFTKACEVLRVVDSSDFHSLFTACLD